MEYMRNFYNDANFRVAAYAHCLGDVMRMCNQMIQLSYTKNTEILNEILELYRFIVEKYASEGSQQAHIVALVTFLKEIWDFFLGRLAQRRKGERDELTQEEQKEDDEISIALQSIIRIMSQIVAVSQINLFMVSYSRYL